VAENTNEAHPENGIHSVHQNIGYSKTSDLCEAQKPKPIIRHQLQNPNTTDIW
jgi:hypothetical protein